MAWGNVREAAQEFWGAGMISRTVRVSKLNAAQRQLKTAIALWFEDGDPVSVHTLAFAAYEIFHSVSEHRDPYRRDLIFDTFHIKDEYRREWLAVVKREANFFKHGDRDSEAIIDFDPDLAEFFMLYSMLARQLCGETPSEEESAFTWWIMFHRPHLLAEQARKSLTDRVPAEYLEGIRLLPKSKFREEFRKSGIGTKRLLIEMG
jgi:hypothetical protein